MENSICPKCGEPRFWRKYINCQDIVICARCSFWDYYLCEDSKGLADLDDKDTSVVDQKK